MRYFSVTFKTLFFFKLSGSYLRHISSNIRGPSCSDYTPSCKDLPDGRNVYIYREWTSYYAECKDKRFVRIGTCPTNKTLSMAEVSENTFFLGFNVPRPWYLMLFCHWLDVLSWHCCMVTMLCWHWCSLPDIMSLLLSWLRFPVYIDASPPPPPQLPPPRHRFPADIDVLFQTLLCPCWHFCFRPDAGVTRLLKFVVPSWH